MSNYHKLPKQGSRQRLVLDTLFAHAQTVDERTLMAEHGLDNLQPTMWRQGPYKSLQADDLICCTAAGFNNSAHWGLTTTGRILMANAVAKSAPAVKPAPSAANLVPPRTARPFRAMTPGTLTIRETRPGALDYQHIPSLYAGKQCA